VLGLRTQSRSNELETEIEEPFQIGDIDDGTIDVALQGIDHDLHRNGDARQPGAAVAGS